MYVSHEMIKKNRSLLGEHAIHVLGEAGEKSSREQEPHDAVLLIRGFTGML